jgi:hypothetical protein
MKLAAALVMFAAGVTAAVMHHDEPTTTTASAPHVDAIDIPRPNPTRVSRYQQRRPIRRHHRPKPQRHTVAVWRSVHDWSGVAQCESGGNWSINTGNGFYGGLQFTQTTWLAFGGGQYAVRADYATALEQELIADRVLVAQGAGAWPICSRYLTVTR